MQSQLIKNSFSLGQDLAAIVLSACADNVASCLQAVNQLNRAMVADLQLIG
jgi:hypothetical protein